MSRGYRYSSVAESPPRSPLFIRVVHTTGSVIHGYRHLAKCPCPSTAVRDSYATLCHSGRNVHVPPLTVSRRITPKDDRITTLYTPWATPSVTVARNSSVYARNRVRMLTVPKFRSRNFRHLKTSVGSAR